MSASSVVLVWRLTLKSLDKGAAHQVHHVALDLIHAGSEKSCGPQGVHSPRKRRAHRDVQEFESET
eukprot:2242624-Amphidinium_carterae.2